MTDLTKKTDGSDNLIKKPNISTFLKIWQIFELIGLLVSIPISWGAGILYTGDSSTVYNFVISRILPLIGLFLTIKVVVTIAFLKFKRWALYFNFIQNSILSILSLGLIIITIIAGAFPVFQVLFLFLFLFISRANLKCLRHPFYQRTIEENKK